MSYHTPLKAEIHQTALPVVPHPNKVAPPYHAVKARPHYHVDLSQPHYKDCETQKEPTMDKLRTFGINHTEVVDGYVFNNQPRKVGQVLSLPGIQSLQVGIYSPNFPKHCYPDVTHNMEIYLNYIKREVQKIHSSTDQNAFFKTFYKFRMNGPFDLKGQLGIPKPGEWVIYKDQLVPDSYLSNMAYGYAFSAYGYPVGVTLGLAQIYSGWSQRFFDQPEDQAAIESGWYQERIGKPWASSDLKPIEYHHAKTQKYPIEYFWKIGERAVRPLDPF